MTAWCRYVDDASGLPYYYNTETGESRWEKQEKKAIDLPSYSQHMMRQKTMSTEDNEAFQDERKDYLDMARVYRNQSRYRDLDAEPLCCICHTEVCLDVIFPCEHKCICRSCQKTNSIGEAAQGAAWFYCPLCCGEIKRMLPHDGHEREVYWKWVLAIKPRLPDGFRDRFEFAGAYLRQKDGDDDHDPIPSCVCLLS